MALIPVLLSAPSNNCPREDPAKVHRWSDNLGYEQIQNLLCVLHEPSMCPEGQSRGGILFRPGNSCTPPSSFLGHMKFQSLFYLLNASQSLEPSLTISTPPHHAHTVIWGMLRTPHSGRVLALSFSSSMTQSKLPNLSIPQGPYLENAERISVLWGQDNRAYGKP